MRRFQFLYSLRIILSILLSCGLLVSCTNKGNQNSAKPNIILILTDDQPPHTMAYMPTIQRELVGKGINFTNAFVTTPLCCPSRASILTGLYAFHHGVKTNRAPEGGATAFKDQSTLAVWLKTGGYRTGFLGKYLNDYGALPRGYIPPGWDEWQVFDHRDPNAGFYYNYSLNENGTSVSYGRGEKDYSTDLLADRAVQFIRDSGQQPFFLMFSVFAPHETYQAAERYKDLFKTLDEFERYRPPNFFEADLTDKPAWASQIGRPEVDYVDKVQERILRSLMSVDDAVGSLVSILEKEKIRDNTLIIFMSDNGMSLGDNGVFGKNCPYDACLRVPMVVSYPPLTSTPRSDDQLVLNIDIAPTLVDLAGLDSTQKFDGHSFLPLLANPSAAWRDGFLIEHYEDTADVEESGLAAIIPGFAGFRTMDWKYIEYETGEKELYDLDADPFEMNNIISDSAHESVVRELSARIHELRP